jgi:hypothetical protein
MAGHVTIASETPHQEASMTSLVRRIAVFAGLAMLASISAAQAQIPNPVGFTTTFPFTVGSTTMPAGSYTVTPSDDDSLLFELTGADRGTGVYFEVESASAPTGAKTGVSFERDGLAYVLKNVWVEGSAYGVEVTTAESPRHHITSVGVMGEQRVPANMWTQEGASSPE